MSSAAQAPKSPDKPSAPSEPREGAQRDPGPSRALLRFRQNKGAMAGAALVVFVTLFAFVGPLFAPYAPERIHDRAISEEGTPMGPGGGFLLGADNLGRDELTRLLFGGRVSMLVAFGSTALAVFLGLLAGVCSGYFGAPLDPVLMRFVDALLSMPFLLIAITLNQIIHNPELWTLCVLLGGLSWMTMARVVRAKTMQVRELAYIHAARALGMSTPRILWRHVLPNVIGPAIVLGSTLVARMIIAESAMSFLGLGVRPPTSSWGSMLRDAQDMMSHAPRLLLLPGLMIVLTVFGFNLLGEGLRDAFDPKE